MLYFGTESEVSYQKTLAVYNDEDSSEAVSPEDPASQEAQCSVPSPREAKLPEISSATLTAGSNLQVKVITKALGEITHFGVFHKLETQDESADMESTTNLKAISLFISFFIFL